MLYDPAQFEPLTEEPWDPARAEDAIATVVADADAAFDLEALWPAHQWDGREEPLPLKSLYLGAAGVIWGSTRYGDATTPKRRSISPRPRCVRSSSSERRRTSRRMSITTRQRS